MRFCWRRSRDDDGEGDRSACQPPESGKGEVDLSGNIDSVAYSDVQAHGKQQENIFSKLFR